MHARLEIAIDTESRGSRSVIQRQLAECGIELNGRRPYDLQILDIRGLDRIFRQGSLGLGEAYMDGLIECERIDQLVERVMRRALHWRFANRRAHRWLDTVARLRNLQTRARARIVGEQHYDIGNALYERKLDPYMNYSRAYWERADSLEAAQRDKMDLVARKLDLSPGMRVLDIGCGWGGMARYAAENYGCKRCRRR